MNVKVRAALEVAGLIVGAAAISGTVAYVLNQLEAAYGTEAVVHGIVFAIVAAAAYTVVGLLYDYRVAQLKSLDKIKHSIDRVLEKQ